MKVIDLTTSLYSDMEVFHGDPQVKIDIVHTYEENTWELRKISMGTHTGTHVDAFSHMHKGKDTLDDISIERFFGKAQVVDSIKDALVGIGLFFIKETGLEMLSEINALKPGFVGGNITEDLERALLGEEVITYTGLVNLELIPKGETFMFYGLPLKIACGDGSPVRAIAILD